MKLYKSLMQLYNIWVILIQITPPKKKLRPNSLTKQEKELKSLLRMFLQVQYFDHEEPSSQVSRHLYGGLMKLLKIIKSLTLGLTKMLTTTATVVAGETKIRQI